MATLDFSSYDGLQAAVATYLRRNNLGDQIPAFIQAAEMRLNLLFTKLPQQLRAWNITPTSNWVNLPTDLASILSVTYNGKTLSQISEQLASAEREKYNQNEYAVIGKQIWIQTQLTSGMPFTLLYYQQVEALDETNTSNWLLEDYPMVYLYATLVEACGFLKDQEGLQQWQTFLTAAVGDVTAQGKQSQIGHGKLSQRRG